MNPQRTVELTVLVILIVYMFGDAVSAMNRTEKRRLRDKVLEMFHHAYGNYMKHAYPADELMPLSCKGRYRDTEPSRGDVDDSLGNFSLTLIDSLDTLVLLGEVEMFEDAVQKVIEDVTFDSDIVVSVFETNIRVLGGLLGGHFLAQYLKSSKKGMDWYKGELLEKAQDLGQRLLPAFNTTTGIPYPRVNLRYGVDPNTARTGHEKDTCTACAGTIILEMAALSRLTGDPRFEAKAHQAMEYLWQQRHRSSDLVGTTINIHNGDWVRRESGVGAGIDSYYEYLLKAYILLGHDSYLERFNKHYDAIMRYISQGPMLMDVHMHRPTTNARNFMDALLAFWPGLQVLKGDIKPAIEVHEMLYQVMQRHNFLPEAFTTDFRVYWGHHPLRPEFVESTYFLYKATSDPYYLEVGKKVMDNLEKHARVECGFAAIKDVTTGQHEDQMDSFVLAETFKYLYLLFSEKEDLILDVDDYVFTTEAHFLPLSLSTYNSSMNLTKDEDVPEQPAFQDDDAKFERSCPNTNYLFPGNSNYAHTVRTPLKDMVENLCPKPKSRRRPRLRALDFIAGNKGQVEELKRMGIKIVTMKDGRVQLLHTASEAGSPEDAEDGMLFMQDMIELSKTQQQEVQQEPRVVQFLSNPYFGHVVLNAGPAQFGYDLKKQPAVQGQLVIANSLRACQPLLNAEDVKGKIVIMERGDCMFIDKARQIEAVGAIGGIVIDNNPGSSSDTAPLFAMSGDGKNDVGIPMVFLFHTEGNKLYEALGEFAQLEVLLGYSAKQTDEVIKDLLAQQKARMRPRAREKMDQSETSSNTVDQSEATGTTAGDQSEPSGTTMTDQSESTRTTTVQSELPKSGTKQSSTTERAQKILQKYLDKIKETEAEMKNKDIPLANIEEILKVVEGPGNARQLSVKLTEDVDKTVNQVYDQLVKLLMGGSQKTDNQVETEKQNNLNKLIEVFYVDPIAQKAKTEKHEPGKRLEPNDEPMPGEGLPQHGPLPPEGSTVSAPEGITVPEGEAEIYPEHYATSEELAGEQAAPRERKAAEWMSVKRQDIYVDQAGNVFKAKDTEEGVESTVPNLNGEGTEEGSEAFQDNSLLYAFSRNLFAQQDNLKGSQESKPQSDSERTASEQLNTAPQMDSLEHGSSVSSTGDLPDQSQETSGHTEPPSDSHSQLNGAEVLPSDPMELGQGQFSQDDRTSVPPQEESHSEEDNERTKDEL